jgi:hypothetical protein
MTIMVGGDIFIPTTDDVAGHHRPQPLVQLRPAPFGRGSGIIAPEVSQLRVANTADKRDRLDMLPPIARERLLSLRDYVAELGLLARGAADHLAEAIRAKTQAWQVTQTVEARLRLSAPPLRSVEATNHFVVNHESYLAAEKVHTKAEAEATRRKPRADQLAAKRKDAARLLQTSGGFQNKTARA